MFLGWIALGFDCGITLQSPVERKHQFSHHDNNKDQSDDDYDDDEGTAGKDEVL